MKKGKIFAVGIGSGARDLLSPRAEDIIKNVEVVAGYIPYVEQIKDLAEGKELISTGMRGEVERCNKALDEAAKGKSVAVVCSGDAGIYGMAGLLMELMEERNDDIDFEAIPGITAANAAAAVLGAPLMNDFVLLSLSDLMTPKEVIEKRAQMAAEADMVCAIYNPSSKKRKELLPKVIEMFRKERGDKLVCGAVRNASREGEEKWLGCLSELPFDWVDMWTILIIGNSQTEIIDGRMITRRGYRLT
jgi:precorrin-3B C17-methyltransferase